VWQDCAVGAEETLSRLGIELPPPPKALASYVPVRIHNGLAYVSGQVASVEGAVMHPGRLGAGVGVEQAQDAARRCALQILSALREALGSLDRVTGVLQVFVFVASEPTFGEQPVIGNAASDLLVDVFGEAGKHSRAAIGVAALPLGASVEVSAVVSFADA
jgi:enamine deaminase RidA (YjgF/YER057c/UK114 family)